MQIGLQFFKRKDKNNKLKIGLLVLKIACKKEDKDKLKNLTKQNKL
jgi:hypothetical protein